MSADVDRRKFLKYTGAAGAATGALWVAPSVLGTSSAFAAGSCINHATLDWSNLGGGTVPTPSPNSDGVGYVNIPASGSSPAIRVNISVNRVGTPGIDNGVYNGLLNQQNGGIAGPQYFVGMENNVSGEGYDVTFDFRTADNSQPVYVYNLAYTVCDIDRAGTTNNGYQDQIVISPTPDSLTSHSTNVTLTPATPDTATATGGGNVAATSNAGNIDVFFSGPVNTTNVRFISGPSRRGAIQSISIPNITWCY